MVINEGLPVTIVAACLREGGGGSPTAVLDEAPLSERERREVPAATGTSHAVFVETGKTEKDVGLRFFTTAGELPACGHGTVAALAFLAGRSGAERVGVTLTAGGRTFAGRAVRDGTTVTAAFDPGPVALREPTAAERYAILPALGLHAGAPEVWVASVGRPRLLVPVPSRAALAGLAPDQDRLKAACDEAGLLGCYVYAVEAGRAAARMFAPSIGVPEDIANANSTACLAAHLSRSVTVDMGDSLSSPSTIIATTTGSNPTTVEVGGLAWLSH
jgi:trans-2,3-dihydro-3-hydroxyanthranilate isomerase